MVYPTSNSVKQYRECFKVDKAYAYYGGKNASFCLGRLESTPFDKFGSVIRTIVRIARRHTISLVPRLLSQQRMDYITATREVIALNGARDEFPIPLYIISGCVEEERREGVCRVLISQNAPSPSKPRIWERLYNLLCPIY